jgi:hypothetical protein
MLVRKIQGSLYIDIYLQQQQHPIKNKKEKKERKRKKKKFVH